MRTKDLVARCTSGRWRAAAVSASVLVVGAGTLVALPVAAGAGPGAPAYSFTTIDNPGDLTFNQLLGIDGAGEIAGYFGSGAAGHPNQGYVVQPPHTSFTAENYPGSVQTQVTGLNDQGTTVGFWSSTNNGVGLDANFGFVDVGGTFTDVNDPSTPVTGLPVNQLLGVNDHGTAVGFYLDSAGNAHGYEYSVAAQTFTPVDPPDTQNSTATGIDNGGAVSGFATLSGTGATVAYYMAPGGAFTEAGFPGATSTMALGVNDEGEVVGTYLDTLGNSHGFTWQPASDTWTTVDDPNGVGTTTVNGVNDSGDLVGFYTDSGGNTDGMLAVPSARATTVSVFLDPSPAAVGSPVTAVVSLDADGIGTVSLSSSFDGGPATPVAGCQNLAIHGDLAACRFVPRASQGPGTYTVAAAYSGDATFAGAIGVATVDVTAATTLTVAPSTSPVAGSPVTMRATVRPAPDAGTVAFWIWGPDGILVPPGCSAVPVTSGQAQCTVTPPAAGAYAVVASYGGDPLYGPSFGWAVVEVAS